MAGNVLFLKLITSWAPKEDVGVYLLASSLVAAFMTISFSPLDQGFFRNISKYKENDELGSRFIAVIFIYICTSCLIALGTGILIQKTGQGDGLIAAVYTIMFWIAVEPIKNTSLILATGLRERSILLKASLLDYGLKISAVYMLYVNFALNAANIIGIFFLSAIAQAGLIFWSYRQLISTRVRLNLARTTIYQSLQFAWPMILWGGFGWLQNMSSRWMINYHTGTAVVAEYGILVSIATMPFNALIGMVGIYIQPILYQDSQNTTTHPYRTVKLIALKLIPICISMVAVTAIFSEPLISLLTSNKYTEKAWALPFIASAVAFNSICTILTYAIFASRKTAMLIAANVIPGVFSIAFGYIVIGKHGFNGALVTFGLSNLMSGLLFLTAYRKAVADYKSIKGF